MKKKLVIAILLPLLLNGCTQKLVPIENKGEKSYAWDSEVWASKVEEYNYIKDYIIVEPGETLHTIAIDNKILAQDLARINNLKYPYKLHTGQRLKLPKIKKHKVKDSDTLYSIAQQYNTTPSTIIKNNNLQPPYIIKVGEMLTIETGEETLLNANKKEELNLASKEASKKINIIQTDTSYKWPVNGEIISSFGPKASGIKNDGINIAAKQGTPIKAIQSGKVVYAGDELSGYGNLVILKHKNGLLSAYAHQQNLHVAKGVNVKAGQIIGYVGKTGNVDTPQLHFAIRNGNRAVDPLKYLPKKLK